MSERTVWKGLTGGGRDDGDSKLRIWEQVYALSWIVNQSSVTASKRADEAIRELERFEDQR